MLAAIEGVGYWVIRSARAPSNIRRVQRARAEKEPRQMSMRRVRWRAVMGCSGRYGRSSCNPGETRGHRSRTRNRLRTIGIQPSMHHQSAASLLAHDPARLRCGSYAPGAARAYFGLPVSARCPLHQACETSRRHLHGVCHGPLTAHTGSAAPGVNIGDACVMRK